MSEVIRFDSPPIEETVRRIVDGQMIEIPIEDAWLYSTDTMTVRFDEGDNL